MDCHQHFEMSAKSKGSQNSKAHPHLMEFSGLQGDFLLPSFGLPHVAIFFSGEDLAELVFHHGPNHLQNTEDKNSNDIIFRNLLNIFI